MTFLNYNPNIPDAPNDPSDDQPLMKTNTNSINSWVAIDHYGFSNNSGGLHKQVRMPKLNSIPTIGSATGCVYVKTVGSTSQLFYSQDGSGNEYQITLVDTPNWATFSAVPSGWTFLPGGLVLQYGNALSTGSATPVVFPKAFTTQVCSLTATRRQSSSTAYGVGDITTVGFNFNATSSDAGVRFYWIAIGY